MNKGCLIFAHNSRNLDYSLLSIISGGLAKKNLEVPVSLVTDQSTVDWMKSNKTMNLAEKVFENIILAPRPETDNKRLLKDGASSQTIPFINFNRSDAYQLSPYDKTLLIDSDYLILSKKLNNYWDVDGAVKISSSIKDLGDDRSGYLDRYISDTGVRLIWATAVMFEKNSQSELFFNTLTTVKNNYSYFADIFRFSDRIYRNDIAFSVTKHILDGFSNDTSTDLPHLYTSLDKDMLIDVKDNGKLIFANSKKMSDDYYLTSVNEVDIHVMNKQSIVRNAEKLLRLI